jgi:transcriptional regulator with XRE-family HTH domain
MTHPLMPNWEQWLDDTTDGETQEQIAHRLGISRRTYVRWVRGGVLDPNSVLALSRAYKADPIEGLLAAHWLRPHDLHNGGMQFVVSFAPTSALVDELHRRLGS